MSRVKTLADIAFADAPTLGRVKGMTNGDAATRVRIEDKRVRAIAVRTAEHVRAWETLSPMVSAIETRWLARSGGEGCGGVEGGEADEDDGGGCGGGEGGVEREAGDDDGGLGGEVFRGIPPLPGVRTLPSYPQGVYGEEWEQKEEHDLKFRRVARERTPIPFHRGYMDFLQSSYRVPVEEEGDDSFWDECRMQNEIDRLQNEMDATAARGARKSEMSACWDAEQLARRTAQAVLPNRLVAVWNRQRGVGKLSGGAGSFVSGARGGSVAWSGKQRVFFQGDRAEVDELLLGGGGGWRQRARSCGGFSGSCWQWWSLEDVESRGGGAACP